MIERMRVCDFLAARGDLDVEDRFFTQLRVRNGVFKMTRRHRFDDTLAATTELIAQHPGRVLDLACSSGISTVELAQALARSGIAREVHGTDAVVHATYLERASYGVLVDHRGDVLQVDHPRWAQPRRPGRRDLALHPVRVIHAQVLRRFVLAGATRATPVELVSSLVATSGVSLHEEDLRIPQLPGTFGFVRVANVLNRSYFPEPELRALVGAVVARLADGGVAFVLRTHEDGSNHGTYFARRGTTMIEVARIGAGSEISELVRQATPAP
jgi:hypothetical protein